MTESTFKYPDRGDNCIACDSRLEPDKFLCTFCVLAHNYAAIEVVG